MLRNKTQHSAIYTSAILTAVAACSRSFLSRLCARMQPKAAQPPRRHTERNARCATAKTEVALILEKV